MISGTFEIHIITDLAHQTELFGYITNLKDAQMINVRPTCAHAKYGSQPIQPMLTYWMKGTDQEVMAHAELIRTQMVDNKIPVFRVKVEAMISNEGVPTVADIDHYFEYHFKIPITSTDDWNKIVKLVTKFGVHLFYNPYNKTLQPIATLRRFDSQINLKNTYEQVKAVLEDNGFELHSLEREYSVYDSCVDYDQRWLHGDSPSSFIVEVSDQMLF